MFHKVHHYCLLFILSDIVTANFADDNTPYMSAANTKSLVKSQKKTASRFFKCFSDNQRKKNSDKFLLLLSSKEKVLTNLNLALKEYRPSRKLMEVIIDNKLSFE